MHNISTTLPFVLYYCEYCPSICNPYQQKYIEKLETTQRRVARFVKNVSYRRDKQPTSVSALLNNLGWESLQTYRLNHSLFVLYRMDWTSRSTTGVSSHATLSANFTLRGHSKQFQHLQPEVDAFKYAFLLRTIPAWNDLPSEVVQADSLDLFNCSNNT